MNDDGSTDRRRTFGQWWDSTDSMVVVSIGELERIGAAAYMDVGASRADAEFLFRTNLDKSIQGDHARGVTKVPGLVAEARRGDLDVAPTYEVLNDKPGSALIDAGPRASGRLVCREGMALAISKARASGTALVGARGSGQLLTPYVRQATEAGMVALVMVQSVPTVAPHGGRGPLLGNAPIAVGIPTGKRDPLILDMSFTESSASGVLLAARQGQAVPDGVLLDVDGRPTTDAAAFPDPDLAPEFGDFCVRGSLVPLGGGHKGFAMVLVVGLLATLLTDTSPPWDLYYHLPHRGRYGTILWVADPAALTGRTPESVGATVDSFLDRVVAAPLVDGVEEILYPGRRSQQLVRERRRRGTISIPAGDASAIDQLARELRIDPLPILEVEARSS